MEAGLVYEKDGGGNQLQDLEVIRINELVIHLFDLYQKCFEDLKFACFAQKKLSGWIFSYLPRTNVMIVSIIFCKIFYNWSKDLSELDKIESHISIFGGPFLSTDASHNLNVDDSSLVKCRKLWVGVKQLPDLNGIPSLLCYKGYVVISWKVIF